MLYLVSVYSIAPNNILSLGKQQLSLESDTIKLKDFDTYS